MYPGVAEVKTRVLLVEDIEHQLSALRKDIQLIPKDQRHTYGIDDFDIDEASSANEALQKLAEAKTSNRLYDLLILDLGLPLNKGENERPQNGYKILEMVKQSGAAKGIIVLSVFSHYSYVVEAFQGGAIDFIEKEFPLRDKIQERVLRSLAGVFAEESNHILEERIKGLVPYAEIGLTHRFTNTFSNLLSSVTRATGEIEKYARERYGLNIERDAQDALMRQLRMHTESVNQARQEWTSLQAQLAVNNEEPQVEVIEDILPQIKAVLLPCLMVKKTCLDIPQSGRSPVLTFHRDVWAVLKEIIGGSLSELPNHGTAQNIKVTVEMSDARIIVRFEDDLKPILWKDAETINKGYNIVPDYEPEDTKAISKAPKLGRVWGLSVAQHIALRGGGELDVKPQAHGNVITYRIPLVHHE